MKIVKKSRGLSGGAFSRGGAGGQEQSPLRPMNVEKLAPCRRTCPSGNHVREFVTAIAQAQRLGKSPEQALQQAWEIYTQTSPFPAVCGRVCPAPCETQCNRKDLDEAVSVHQIERAIGDFGIDKQLKLKGPGDQKMPQRIAVVGAGFRGLSCAYHLARAGYAVTVFEALQSLHWPDGTLPWGFSSYRLPASALNAEVQRIFDLGIELKCGVRVGKDVGTEELQKSYDAVVEAYSVSHKTRLGLEGEDAPNVLAAADFLSHLYQGDKIDIGHDVVIVGGSDCAVGAALACKRLGASVTILYRRTIAEMPAISSEVQQAIAQGVRIEASVAPVALTRDGQQITAVRCVRMKLSEPDSSGRQNPVPVEGSEFDIPASVIISAPAAPLVTTLVGQGRQAAEEIDARFRGKSVPKLDLALIRSDKMRLNHYAKRPAPVAAGADLASQSCAVATEFTVALTQDQLVTEAKWCMSCGYCFDCEKCWLYCQEQGIVKPAQKGALYSFKTGVCTGCKKCAEECPCGFIEMR